MKTKFLTLAVCSLLLFSCSKEEDSNAENQAPASFSITVWGRNSTSTGINKTAKLNVPSVVVYDLSWTEAIDPEKDAVTYDVEIVGGSTIATNSSTRELVISGSQLNPNQTTTQTVKITAKDSKGATTIVTKEFEMGLSK
jgi:hypothetical protein